ncbi:hypothetical protein J6590_048630 [Homalodisca vitripennis]|nr:hypothetical protein J6590_048630 [Homalodisca vitripennis]
MPLSKSLYSVDEFMMSWDVESVVVSLFKYVASKGYKGARPPLPNYRSQRKNGQEPFAEQSGALLSGHYGKYQLS